MTDFSFDASVIVATYKQLEPTRLALQALFAQRTEFSYEVIVCDDGSEPETIMALSEILEHAPIPARLTWQQDRGFRAAASRNNGIRLAHGRVLIFLDGDMVPVAHFVDAHVRAHEQERVIAVGKRRYRGPEVFSGGPHEAETIWALLQDPGIRDDYALMSEFFEKMFRQFMQRSAAWANCYSCNISVRNTPLVEFDESFTGWGCEDWDLFFRLNVVHEFAITTVDAVAYDVRGGVDRAEVWQQSDYIVHLCNGFRFLDKWSNLGLTAAYAVPRYALDPETGLWSMSNGRIFDEASEDFPEYAEMARDWLVRNGFYSARAEDSAEILQSGDR